MAPLLRRTPSTVGQSGLDIFRVITLSGAVDVVDFRCAAALLRLLTHVFALPALKGKNRACHRQLGALIRPECMIGGVIILITAAQHNQLPDTRDRGGGVCGSCGPR